MGGEPDLVVEGSAAGPATVRVVTPDGGWYLHSRYDPVAASRQWAAGLGLRSKSVLVVYGLGLGYHVEALWEIASPLSVTVLEQSPAVARLAGQHGVLERLRALGTTVVVEPDPQRLARRLEEEVGRCHALDGHLVVHEPSVRLLPPPCAGLRAALEKWVLFDKTRRASAPALAANLQANATRMQELPGIGLLKGLGTGIPGFLVAGGPSLDEALPHLGGALERGLVLAVGTALRPLATVGLTPHLAILTDPSPKLVRHFEGVEDQPSLVVFPTVHPAVLQAYRGPLLAAFQAGVEEAERLAALRGEPVVESGGSVSTAAFSVLELLGCEPIVFVGLDLGWPGGRTHARAAPGFRSGVTGTRQVLSNAGEPIPTTANLDAYRTWFENRLLARPDRTVFNTALRGARIRGAPFRPLSDLLASLPPLPEATRQRLKYRLQVTGHTRSE
ncbi:motility associated factor glycosyltransferase family protein [Caldinitratiruptor microaerophilus]|uniref:6-hydroxymethylpterin diphosphokinase MptE-like domain-containing protein n=1 Tax=Caldinitratiruptor microaerophilus TaxID=671077 RepID=A0AA35CPM4_9FIRM|nr:6-hydroxymethylpterin diphosphokinase MptE-like protein [Caldinitratiruptor microaerophilus]BDG61737.1 hypothetical protein caldi_28270 [Caldinitratiruptor microaerophilus]